MSDPELVAHIEALIEEFHEDPERRMLVKELLVVYEETLARLEQQKRRSEPAAQELKAEP